MCNNLHKDSQPIEKQGVGWKIFLVDIKKYLKQPFAERSRYKKRKDGSVSWIKTMKYGQGFCFFTDQEEADKLLKDLKDDVFYSKCVVVKIRYEKGLGEHDESGVTHVGSYKTALCRNFRLHEDEQKYKL